MSVYYLGNDVDIELTVRDDITLALTNATTQTLVVTKPDGTTDTPPFNNTSTGQYACVYQPLTTGHYTYTWTTTGPAGTLFGQFDVLSGQRTLSSITLKDLIDETLTNLHGYTSDLEQMTALSQSITASATSFNVADASQISQGLIEIDSELMWVTNIDRTLNAVTIAPFGRGFRETDPVAHNQNVQITDNPRFPRQSVKMAIQQTLSALYPGVFQILTDETNTVNPVRISYPVPGNCDLILDVRWQTVGPSQLWKQVKRYKLDYRADQSSFPSGKSLEIYDGMMPGRPIKVTYMVKPGDLADEASTLGEAGLSETCRDILIYGACYRLLTAVEAGRLQTWSVTQAQRDQLVPAGAADNASKYYYALYTQRLHDEQMRLQKLYPAVLHKTR